MRAARSSSASCVPEVTEKAAISSKRAKKAAGPGQNAWCSMRVINKFKIKTKTRLNAHAGVAAASYSCWKTWNESYLELVTRKKTTKMFILLGL